MKDLLNINCASVFSCDNVHVFGLVFVLFVVDKDSVSDKDLFNMVLRFDILILPRLELILTKQAIIKV